MYKIFSVDDHIVEPPDVWTSRVSAKHRDRAPHVVEEDGREYWEYEDSRVTTMGLNAVAGTPPENWNLEPARFEDMIPGCWDPKARAKDMLSQGVCASLNFPTLPRFGGMLFTTFQDKELADECVRAWNDFVLDEWCPAGPDGLFVPMIICQLWDPQAAAAEIRRCSAKGARAISMVENPVPGGLPSFHTDAWNPIWEAAQETDMPVCMHIGSAGLTPIPDPNGPFALISALANVAGLLSMSNFLASSICLDHPDLKVVWSEGGIGWIPAVLERLDRQLDRHAWSTGARDLKPSDIFRRNMYACMIEEPIGLSLHELIGTDRIFCETDYPHSDSSFPETQKGLGDVFAGIPDDVVAAVTHENAERAFNWKMADPALIDSPEVVAWRDELESDPYAAMKYMRPAEGVVHQAASCAFQVAPGGDESEKELFGAQGTRCGAPVGPDGICSEGHTAA